MYCSKTSISSRKGGIEAHKRLNFKQKPWLKQYKSEGTQKGKQHITIQ